MFDMTPYANGVASKAIKHYGEDKQKIKAIEEMAELQKEVAKDLNGNPDRQQLKEEFADVYYMMYQLAKMYRITPSVVTGVIRAKAVRLNVRIEKEREENA